MPIPSRFTDLTIVTISTVGYGDISPSTPGMQVFTVFYILIGCGFVFAQLSHAFAGVLEAFTSWVKRLINIFDTTEEGVDTTGDGKRDTHVAGRSSGMSGSAHDLTGDGHADFIDPPMAAVYWAQELLPAMLLLTCAPEFEKTEHPGPRQPEFHTQSYPGPRQAKRARPCEAEAEGTGRRECQVPTFARGCS